MLQQQFQADSKKPKKTVAGAKGAAGRKKSTTGSTQDGVPVDESEMKRKKADATKDFIASATDEDDV
jgi:hypothetical protein